MDQALSAEDWLSRIEETLKAVAAGDATLTPEQLIAKLRELAPGATASASSPTAVVSERITRGYKVRRSYAPITEEERKAKEAVTVQAIAHALKKLRQ
jgi:hypothetical protein